LTTITAIEYASIPPPQRATALQEYGTSSHRTGEFKTREGGGPVGACIREMALADDGVTSQRYVPAQRELRPHADHGA
jgi:hypothetical protein